MLLFSGAIDEVLALLLAVEPVRRSCWLIYWQSLLAIALQNCIANLIRTPSADFDGLFFFFFVFNSWRTYAADNTCNSAAFFVSCYEECKEAFYKEETWPEGAELRDRYFK